MIISVKSSMKISSSFTSNMSRQAGTSFKQIVIPEPVAKLAQSAGEHVSLPEQKLFLATTTLMFAPFIDLMFAREDKKIDSAIKTASKAIAGGITGVSIRALGISMAKKYIGFGKNNIINNNFLPSSAVKLRDKAPEVAQRRLDEYCKTMGTIVALLVMICFTNFKIDVPLTNDIQDIISGIAKENKTILKSFADVKDNRKRRIKNWFESKVKKIKQLKEKAVKIEGILNDGKKRKTAEKERAGKTS